MRIEIHHTYRGCECECCGHQIEVYPDDNDDRCYHSFDFDHPDGNEREYALGIAEEFLKKYHPELLALVDWSTMVVDVTSRKNCLL